LNLVRGFVATALGGLIAFGVMASPRHIAFGVPIGAIGIVLAVFGVLDLLGSFDDSDERVAKSTRLGALLPSLAVFGGGAGATLALLGLAVAGYLPVAASAVAIPAAFLATLLGAYRVAERLGVFSDGRPLHKRHGFWLVAVTTVLYLPMLGSHSLTDPWETHYGEVAREILSRNDWISLWWAQDGWFWSKPVLDFWIQAIAMAVLGVRYAPGQMLAAAAEGRTPWPEWAVRMPIFLFTLVAVYLLYKAVARAFGRRAGLLGGLVLVTMPQWFLVTHQTMTDMPFVATMSATMALFLLGVHEDPHRKVRVYELVLGRLKLRLSAYHLVMGAILACALPQILYLFSRNVDLSLAPLALRLHADSFLSGSPGNCGLPGNHACGQALPSLRGLTPAIQGLLWLQTLAIFLYVNWGERRAQRLLFLGAWLFAALSTMAKGPAGFGLPILCALAYVATTRRWRELSRMEIASGALILLAVAMPWFVAMFARHGQPFTDRLLFHDMFKRAFTHVHDTNEGDDVSFRFYVWQLGYAMFPWTALAPAGLVWWLRRKDDGDARGDASVFLAMWFVFAFTLFSLMLTKFHHYILPALPPAAMLIGVLLSDMMEPRARSFRAHYESLLLGGAAVSGALLVAIVGRDLIVGKDGLPSQARLLHLFTYNYRRAFPPSLDFRSALTFFTIAAAVLVLALAVARIRRIAVVALVALGGLFAAWGIDVYFVKTSPHWGQRETVLAYQRIKRQIPGPIVAYQMNWKGENFYMGNAIPAFVSSGKKFQDYMLGEKKKGIKTFYFMTEHGRATSLSNELGSPSSFEKLTTPELNNKFVLVRATFE
jgi:4-amino-4-deoxy-L-arabinose transferase-like glycosyltransferase